MVRAMTLHAARPGAWRRRTRPFGRGGLARRSTHPLSARPSTARAAPTAVICNYGLRSPMRSARPPRRGALQHAAFAEDAPHGLRRFPSRASPVPTTRAPAKRRGNQPGSPGGAALILAPAAMEASGMVRWAASSRWGTGRRASGRGRRWPDATLACSGVGDAHGAHRAYRVAKRVGASRTWRLRKAFTALRHHVRYLRSSIFRGWTGSMPSGLRTAASPARGNCVTAEAAGLRQPALRRARWVRSNATKNVESRERSRSVSIPPMLKPLLLRALPCRIRSSVKRYCSASMSGSGENSIRAPLPRSPKPKAIQRRGTNAHASEQQALSLRARFVGHTYGHSDPFPLVKACIVGNTPFVIGGGSRARGMPFPATAALMAARQRPDGFRGFRSARRDSRAKSTTSAALTRGPSSIARRTRR